MPKYTGDTIPICVAHDRANQTKICKRCHVNYCSHFASTTDVRYCANCMGDFTLKQTIIERTDETLRPDGSVSFSRKYQAMMTKLEGTDWLFNANLIENMTDDEIEQTIEYHRANVGLMLQERESRKLERIKKLSSIKVHPITRKSQHQLDKDAEPKKTRSKTKTLSPEETMKVMMSMFTPEQILAMLQGGK